MSYQHSVRGRIHHLRLEKSVSLDDVLTELGLSTELIDLGAIYQNKTRIYETTLLEKDDYLRIHAEPRRFPKAQINWRKRIIEENDDFVAIDKPPSVPTHASLDNAKENCLFQMSRTLEMKLWAPYRLDIGTSGVLLLVKRHDFLLRFVELLEKKKVRKTYEARVSGKPPKLGFWQHFMKSSQRSPKELSPIKKEGWKNCELEVLEVEDGEFHRAQINLITGRTHQIRAQLSFSESPILGDQLYGSIYDWQGQKSQYPLGEQNSEPIALRCQSLQFETKTVSI